MKNKSICILGTRGIPAQYGGFETFAEELSKRLVKRGVRVSVFCPQKKDSLKISSYEGVGLVHVKEISAGPLTTILFDVLSIIKACKGYDIIYILGYGAAPFCLLPRLIGRKFG